MSTFDTMLFNKTYDSGVIPSEQTLGDIFTLYNQSIEKRLAY